MLSITVAELFVVVAVGTQDDEKILRTTLAEPVGTTKMCRKEQNLSETDRFCVLGPLELVERGTYNRFI